MKVRLLLAQDDQVPISCELSGIIPPAEGTVLLQRGNCKYKELRIQMDEVIFTVSCLTAIVILNLPMDYIDGKPIPAVVFHGLPSTFHAFLVCLMGSCCASVCSMHLRDRKLKIAKFYYFFALLSTLLSLAIFFWAAVPATLLWVASIFR